MPIVPVPADAPPMTYKHPVHGKYSQRWAYQDKNRGLVGYVLRYDYRLADGASGKEFNPLTYCDTDTGPRWEAQSFPIPRPLYGLPAIFKRPNATVMVCQGEKAAEAAGILFPDMIATTAPGGLLSIKNADWTALVGRKIIISPNAGGDGDEFASAVGQLAYQAGAADVWILHPEKLVDGYGATAKKRPDLICPQVGTWRMPKLRTGPLPWPPLRPRNPDSWILRRNPSCSNNMDVARLGWDLQGLNVKSK